MRKLKSGMGIITYKIFRHHLYRVKFVVKKYQFCKKKSMFGKERKRIAAILVHDLLIKENSLDAQFFSIIECSMIYRNECSVQINRQ